MFSSIFYTIFTKYKFIFYLILTNTILYVITYKLGMDRPLINIDYVSVYLIYIIFNKKLYIKKIVYILVLCIGSLELLLIVNQIFPFVKIGDILYLSTFIFFGPISYQKWFILGVVYLVIINFAISNYFFKIFKINDIKIVVVFLLVITMLSPNSFRSQILFFLKNYNKDYVKLSGNTNLLIDNKYDSVTKSLFNISKNNKKNNKILLVVNESWGKSNSKDIQDDILKPLYSYRKSLDYIESGSFNFIGATVSGELRELCHKTSTVMNITKVEDNEFSKCLPSKFKELGYKTYSIHGADSKLYDRKRWYSLVGFDYSLFKDSFNGGHECKSFSGKCDYELIEPIANIIMKNEKVFVYWLTLNTHAPYDDILFINNFDCQKHGLKDYSESCLNFKQQYQFFSRFSEYVTDERFRGLEVFIVGDHAPPIMSLKDNFSVYDGTSVSWIKFKIKD